MQAELAGPLHGSPARRGAGGSRLQSNGSGSVGARGRRAARETIRERIEPSLFRDDDVVTGAFDESFIDCIFPDGKSRAGGPPRVHHVRITARLLLQPFQKVQNKRAKVLRHGNLPGLKEA